MACRVLNLVLAASLFGGAAFADTAYVTCQNGEVLSVIDLGTGARQDWVLPGKPAGVAVTAGAVFTVSPDDKTVRRLDLDSGAVRASVLLDGGPIGIALSDDRVFVSDWYNARIWVLDHDLTVLAELATGAAPAGLAVSADGLLLASADRDADQVSIFDLATMSLVAVHPVGERPFGLRFAPDRRLFVGNVGSNDVTVLDPVSGLLATIPVGERPYGVAFAAGRAFVTNQYENTVSVIALDSLTEIARIDVGEYPEGIDTEADGSGVFVANWFDNSLERIDAESLQVTDQWDTGDGPRAFGTFLLGGGD